MQPLSANAPSFNTSRSTSGSTATSVTVEDTVATQLEMARVAHEADLAEVSRQLEANRIQREANDLEQATEAARQVEVARIKHELEKCNIALNLPNKEFAKLNISLNNVAISDRATLGASVFVKEVPVLANGRLVGAGTTPWVPAAGMGGFHNTQDIWTSAVPNRGPIHVAAMNAALPTMQHGQWNNVYQQMYGSQTMDRRDPPSTGASSDSSYMIAGNDSLRYPNGPSHPLSGASSRPHSSGILQAPYQRLSYGDMNEQRKAALGPVGSRLSPTATVFPYNTNGVGPMGPSPWNAQVRESHSLCPWPKTYILPGGQPSDIHSAHRANQLSPSPRQECQLRLGPARSQDHHEQ
jgi:hypothetical protein